MIFRVLKFFTRSVLKNVHGYVCTVLSIFKKQPVGSPPIKDLIDESSRMIIRHQIRCKWDVIDRLQAGGLENEIIECPLCSKENSTKSFKKLTSSCIFEGGVLHRLQCPNCDLIFGPSKMLGLSNEELSHEYNWHYKVFDEVDSTSAEIRAFQSLMPTKSGVYLNWGAGGWSKTISKLRSDGWNVFGYEPHCAASSRESFVINNIQELKSMKFDGVFSNNVLEHLKDPVEELKLMASLLNDNGKMSHATPCFEYLYEYTRFHLFFFVGKSKALLFNNAELQLDSYTVDGHFMNAVLSRRDS